MIIGSVNFLSDVIINLLFELSQKNLFPSVFCPFILTSEQLANTTNSRCYDGGLADRKSAAA